MTKGEKGIESTGFEEHFGGMGDELLQMFGVEQYG
jgi:hypothetical protein